MSTIDWDRSEPVSLKPDKQIYAQRNQGRAISVLRIPDEKTLRTLLERREALLAAAGDCARLNLPKNQRVISTPDGYELIEEMALAGPEGSDQQFTEDLLEGIRELHRAGWVHMDIKPEHLLWANGHWMLHDFDGAKPIGESFRERDITFEYAPPDVMWRTRADVSDDLYAAALILYRRLNGNRLPFERGSERRAALIRRWSPYLPVPGEWGSDAQRFFRRALSHIRSRRFHSIDEFIDAWKHVELMWKAGENYGEYR